METKCPARRSGIHSLCVENPVQRWLHGRGSKEIELAIAEMGNEVSPAFTFCIIVRGVLVQGFGPEHTSHMQIKRNFSFPLGPSLPVQSKAACSVPIVKPKCIYCFCFVYILYRLSTVFAFSQAKEAWVKKEDHHISINKHVINNAFV